MDNEQFKAFVTIALILVIGLLGFVSYLLVQVWYFTADVKASAEVTSDNVLELLTK